MDFAKVAVFPSSVISLLLHTRHFNTAFIRRTSGRSLETFKQSSTISDVGERLTEGSLRPHGTTGLPLDGN